MGMNIGDIFFSHAGHSFINLLSGTMPYGGVNSQWNTNTRANVEYIMDNFDDRGIPTRELSTMIPNGNGNMNYLFWPQTWMYPEQRYVVRWTGTGALGIRNYAGLQVIRGSGYKGSGVFAGTDVRCEFRFTGEPDDNDRWYWPTGRQFSNMGIPLLCRAKWEQNWLYGHRWNPEYINWVKQLQPRGLRFMQTIRVPEYDATDSLQFSYGTKKNHVVNLGPQFPRQIYVGQISGNGATYVCNRPADHEAVPEKITPGEMFWGYVSTPSGNNPTLNCGDRGAKKIIRHLDYSSINPSIGSEQQRVHTFCYDEVLDAYIATHEPPYGNGPGLELCIDLCNEVNCGIWYNFMNYCSASDAKKIARYIADNLHRNNGQECFLEYGNEVWGGVNWTNLYCQALGLILHPPSGMGNSVGYAYKVATLMPAAEQGWNESTRPRHELIITSADSIVNDGWSRAVGAFTGYLTGWGTLITNPQFSHLVGAAYACGDAIACAPYTQGGPIREYPQQYAPWDITNNRPAGRDHVSGTLMQQLLDTADQYVEGNATQKHAALVQMDNWMRYGPGGDNFGYWDTIFPHWERAAAGEDSRRASLVPPRPPLRVMAYEGNPSLGPPSSSILQRGYSGDWPAYPAAIDAGHPNITGWPPPVADKYGYGGGKPGRILQLFTAYRNSEIWRDYCYDWCRMWDDATRYPHMESIFNYRDVNASGPLNDGHFYRISPFANSEGFLTDIETMKWEGYAAFNGKYFGRQR